MKTKIYSAPEEITKPTFDFANFNAVKHQEKEDKYLEALKKFLKVNGYDGKNVGETIKFPVADSHAVYMIASMKPLILMEVPVGDEWTFEFAHLMTEKEVQKKLDQDKAMAKLFSKKNP